MAPMTVTQSAGPGMPNIAPRRYVEKRPPGMAAPGVKQPARCALCGNAGVTAVGEHRLCAHHTESLRAVEQMAADRREHACALGSRRTGAV